MHGKGSRNGPKKIDDQLLFIWRYSIATMYLEWYERAEHLTSFLISELALHFVPGMPSSALQKPLLLRGARGGTAIELIATMETLGDLAASPYAPTGGETVLRPSIQLIGISSAWPLASTAVRLICMAPHFGCPTHLHGQIVCSEAQRCSKRFLGPVAFGIKWSLQWSRETVTDGDSNRRKKDKDGARGVLCLLASPLLCPDPLPLRCTCPVYLRRHQFVIR